MRCSDNSRMNVTAAIEHEVAEETGILDTVATIQSRFFDVIVIGGGVAGLSAAISVAENGWRALVVRGTQNSASDFPGGLVSLTEELRNYPGFSGRRGCELIASLYHHASRVGAFIVDSNAVNVVFDDMGLSHEVYDSQGTSYFAPKVVIATGSRPTALGVEGEEKLRDRGVSNYAYLDGEFFRGEHVVVVGGGATAYENARILERFAKSVTVVHRRDGSPSEKRLLSLTGVKIMPRTDVLAINGVSTVDSVTVTTPRGPREIPARGVFVSIGHTPHFGFTHNLGGVIDSWSSTAMSPYCTVVDIPGVFLAGSLSGGACDLAVAAASSGTAVGVFISNQLRHQGETE